MRLLTLLMSALTIVALVGCGGGGGGGGSTGEPVVTNHWATGHWSGQVLTIPDPTIMEISIAHDGTITGSGLRFLSNVRVTGTIDQAGMVNITLDPVEDPAIVPTPPHTLLQGTLTLGTDEDFDIKLSGQVNQMENDSLVQIFDLSLNLM